MDQQQIQQFMSQHMQQEMTNRVRQDNGKGFEQNYNQMQPSGPFYNYQGQQNPWLMNEQNYQQ